MCWVGIVKVNLFELSEIQPFKQLVDEAIAQVAQQ
jgi:hypothetical protein